MKKYITDVHRWKLRRISSSGHLQIHEFKVSLGYRPILSQKTARFGGVHFSYSTWEAEASEPPNLRPVRSTERVPGQPGLHTEKHCLEKQIKIKLNKIIKKECFHYIEIIRFSKACFL